MMGGGGGGGGADGSKNSPCEIGLKQFCKVHAVRHNLLYL